MAGEYKIWIVDDDPDDRHILGDAIKKVMTNAVVTSLNDGHALFEELIVKEGKPDLIFLDLNMGIYGGRQTLKLMKMDQNFSSVPVVILTTADTDERDQLMGLGASGFYNKPSSTSELEAIVLAVKNNFLDRRL
jgi:DNA-binding NarL/FixJ family response regulator